MLKENDLIHIKDKLKIIDQLMTDKLEIDLNIVNQMELEIGDKEMVLSLCVEYNHNLDMENNFFNNTNNLTNK